MRKNFEIYTEQAKAALKYSTHVARDLNNNYVGTEHILMALCKVKNSTAQMILEEFGVETEKLQELISKLIAPPSNVCTDLEPDYTPRSKRLMQNSEDEANAVQAQKVGTEHLLIAMLKDTECVATRLLYTMGVNIQKMFLAVLAATGMDKQYTQEELQNGKFMKPRENAAVATPTLDQYSRDLTEQAASGKLDPVVGREEEIARLVQILSRRTKNNPCLVGEPGVGKTAIVEGLAQRIVWGLVPESMKDKRLVVLDLSSMVAGTKYRGEFEERIKNVVKEVTEHRGILLFIDELHTIIGAGGAEGALDASNILKPSLSRGEIQLIGATTIE